ncbi:MAG: SemiSWEET transporter [Thermodesulfobacteriota bacterium]
MSLVTIIGLAAAAFTTVSFVPQAVKIIKIRETRDISLLTYLLLETGIFLWFVYGILIVNLPVILANGITLVFTTIIVILKIKFG